MSNIQEAAKRLREAIAKQKANTAPNNNPPAPAAPAAPADDKK